MLPVIFSSSSVPKKRTLYTYFFISFFLEIFCCFWEPFFFGFSFIIEGVFLIAITWPGHAAYPLHFAKTRVSISKTHWMSSSSLNAGGVFWIEHVFSCFITFTLDVEKFTIRFRKTSDRGVEIFTEFCTKTDLDRLFNGICVSTRWTSYLVLLVHGAKLS